MISFRLNAENAVAEEDGGNGNSGNTNELQGGGGGGCSLAQDTPLKSNALLLWMGFVVALMSLRYKFNR